MHLKRLGVAAATLLLAADPVAAAQQDLSTISLHSGHSTIIPAPGLTRVAVGDAKIAGVVTIGNSEVIVNGKMSGQTSLFIWRGAKRTSYEVSVSEQTMDDVAAMLRSAITEPGVNVAAFNRSIVVNGSVDTPQAAARIASMVDRFQNDAKTNKYSIVDAVALTRPLGTLNEDLKAVAGAAGVTVDRDPKGNLIVSGRVPDTVVAESVLERVRALGGTYLPADGKVIDRLTPETTSQIDVKVYVLEVDRTALDQLGVRLQNAVPDPSHPGFYNLGDPLFPALETAATAGHLFNIGAFYRTTVLAPTLDLIMRTGHAKLLSAPDLVTMPGRQATFLVGGEIPIPYASGIGQISIQYKEFGVRLQMTPTVLGSGGIETKIAPEVSDLDYQNAVQISGFLIPALKTSRLSTDVITRDGESIVMGGLMRRIEQRALDKIPLLSSIPVLGKLFRSNRYQKAETDVVFVMTPRIVTR